MSPDTLNDILGYVSTAAFTLLGLVSLRHSYRRRDAPSIWAALCFGQPSVARHRMQMLSFAALAMTIGLLLGDLVYEPLRPHGARFELVVPVGTGEGAPGTDRASAYRN